MIRLRSTGVWVVAACVAALNAQAGDAVTEIRPAQSGSDAQATPAVSIPAPPISQAEESLVIPRSAFAESLAFDIHQNNSWIALKSDSAEFPKASKIPGTEVWWKFGGFIKGDFIHDFQPAGTTDRFVPTTIPVDDSDGQNTLMQAKATRLNLDVRAPSDWGTVRGFVETDFFTDGNQLRLRHAYVEVGNLLAGQTWTVFTDPNGIPRTLDFESPVAFIVQRQAQFRWTETVNDNLKWAFSIENPTTSVDDIVTATIPGQPAQPLPDLATHLKYTSDSYEWFIAGLFRDLSYRPDVGSEQERFGCALNLVGILHPSDTDKIIGQFVMGSGLGRYRGGSDLRLASPTKVDTVDLVGGCVGITHGWTETLSSTGAYSFALRRKENTDPGDTERLANYLAVNLIWEPIPNTSMGIEYLYGTDETRDGDFGDANRIQASVQYNFP